jgi:hypothetical protein
MENFELFGHSTLCELNGKNKVVNCTSLLSFYEQQYVDTAVMYSFLHQLNNRKKRKKTYFYTCTCMKIVAGNAKNIEQWNRRVRSEYEEVTGYAHSNASFRARQVGPGPNRY